MYVENITTNTETFTKLPAHHFTFEKWRAGSLSVFGIRTRKSCIINNRVIIRRNAVGFVFADRLWVRPKENAVAVMFWTENEGYFWCHVTIEEFYSCFPELKN